MASARRTGTNENISTYGSAVGRDYSALGTWEAATDIDLVSGAQSEVLECYRDSTSYTDSVTLAGATTDDEYFRIIRPATGALHRGDPDSGIKFTQTFTTGNNIVLSINENYSQIQDVVVTASATTGNIEAVTLEASSDEAAVVGLIVYNLTSTGTSSSLEAIVSRSTAGVNYIIDCLVFDILPGAGNSVGKGIQTTSLVDTAYIYNCTVRNVTGQGISTGICFDNSSGNPVYKNCLGDQDDNTNTHTCFGGGAGGGSDYNLSTDATAPGSNSILSSTGLVYQDEDTDDYHLKSTSAGYDDGVDLSADTFYAFDDDIDQQTITVWAIGCDCDGIYLVTLPTPPDDACVCSEEDVLETVNNSLIILGGEPIFSLEGTKAGNLASRIWASTVKRMQQSYRWEFCLRRLVYTANDQVDNTTAPDWGFSYRFLLPSNMLQLWDVNEPHENPRYRTENKYLLTDEPTPEILYSVYVDDVAQWSPLFLEAFEYKLAARLAMPLLHKPDLMNLYEKMYQEKVQEAATLNSMMTDDYSSYSTLLYGARQGFNASDVPLELSDGTVVP